MKRFLISLVILLFVSPSVFSAKPPALIGQYLEANKTVKGEVVKMTLPPEYFKFRGVIEKAQKADPVWFKKYTEELGEDVEHLPYDVKLGITKTEYDKYTSLWKKRKYERVKNGKVQIILTKDEDDEWVINVSGKGMRVSLLKYSAKKDQFKSDLGELKRIKDINTNKERFLGAWRGHEWRYSKVGKYSIVKENFVLCKTVDGRYGIIVYSLKEMTNLGRSLADDLLIIRFVPRKLKK